MPLEVGTLLLPEENDILLNDVSEVSLRCIEDELGAMVVHPVIQDPKLVLEC